MSLVKRHYWEHHWQHWTWLTWLLLPVSGVFCLLAALRRSAYRHRVFASLHVGVPVIVVGNISVGGTGKTPLTLWLAHRLAAAGWRPGIVMRGYGGSVAATPTRVTRDAAVAAVGDEALLVARASDAPVVVARDRARGARALQAAGCDVVLCDDGLQHYRLRRHIEIAVIDGARGVGNGLCLPAGPLREPVRRLAQVSACIVNGGDTDTTGKFGPRAWPMALRPQCFVRLADGAEFPLTHFADAEVQALAGIGNPARFFNTLMQLGVRATPHVFADHYHYRGDEPVFAHATPTLMTEKDAVKCAAFARDNMYYLAVAAAPADGFAEFILQRLRERHGQKAA